jgi:hypothetical protein
MAHSCQAGEPAGLVMVAAVHHTPASPAVAGARTRVSVSRVFAVWQAQPVSPIPAKVSPAEAHGRVSTAPSQVWSPSASGHTAPAPAQ